jgi:hypothetical protein
MKKATDGRRNGIQWTMFNQLDDLDFADDIALLFHSHQQMQEKLTQVERRAAETGLSINSKKTKVLKSNTKTQAGSDSKWPKSGRSRLLYLPWKRSRQSWRIRQRR